MARCSTSKTSCGGVIPATDSDIGITQYHQGGLTGPIIGFFVCAQEKKNLLAKGADDLPIDPGAKALRAILFRDNDAIYGNEVGRFLKGTGIEEVRTAFRSPWQNPFVERYVGILRRELLDHVLVLNEEHLTRLLREFINEYYHIARPHYGLDGETPFPTDKPALVTEPGRLVSIPVVGGLHHRYMRVAA